MRKLLTLTIILLTFGCGLYAQPRSAGFRFAPTSVEFAYQHYFGQVSFLEVDLGVDAVGDDGFKVTGLYDWEFAHPQFGWSGTWTWYAGLGPTLGYVCAKTKSDDTPGCMIGGAIDLGCEYQFPFRLAIAVDIRPQFGYHFRAKGFYDAGLLGLIPALSIKYIF